MFPTLQIGPAAIQVPGLLLLAGLWLALNAAEKNAARLEIKPALIYNLAFLALAAGAIGGRAAVAARFPDAFIADPLSLISPNPRLFDPLAGAVFGLLAGWIYGYRKGLDLWKTLDAFTPGFAVMAVAAGAAHLASGSAFGAPARVPWAIELWGELRHPSQVYEIIAALAVLALVLPRTGLTIYRQRGLAFLTFCSLSAGARLFLEAFRGDSPLLAGSLRIPQLIAWVILAGCLIAIRRRRPTPERDSEGSRSTAGDARGEEPTT